jgi:hypothetical protein
MKLSEIATRVIELARCPKLPASPSDNESYIDELDEAPDEVDEAPDDSEEAILTQWLQGRPESEQSRQLRQFLLGQSTTVIYSLVLLMYVGRGDIEPRHVEKQRQHIRHICRDQAWAVSWLVSKAPLADYLETGLRICRQKNIDLDRWMR